MILNKDFNLKKIFNRMSRNILKIFFSVQIFKNLFSIQINKSFSYITWLSTPRIKNFYCIPTDKCEKSSTQSELTIQSGRHLPCLWLVGWLNSGAPALAIRHHLLKVGIFTQHRRNIVFFTKGKKK